MIDRHELNQYIQTYQNGITEENAKHFQKYFELKELDSLKSDRLVVQAEKIGILEGLQDFIETLEDEEITFSTVYKELEDTIKMVKEGEI